MSSIKDCTCAGFLGKLQRRKTLPSDVMATPLKRCLNTFDLTLMGMSHMIGGGVYVLSGTVASQVAGPAVVFSYILAGLVSVLVALCYAEFGSKIPKAGSAYTYTYIILGELCAFFVGWNIVLELVIAAASVARVWSGSINVLSGGAVENGTLLLIGGSMNGSFLSNYPDFLAAALILLVSVFVALGVEFNALINNVFGTINAILLTFVIVTGFVIARPSYWVNAEGGGPMPYGFGGVLAGAAMCFFAYAGFECITQASEESVDPSRAVPVSILSAVGVVSVLYVLASLSLTMIVPYTTLDIVAPFARAFEDRGLVWAMYVTSAGIVTATMTATLTAAFSTSRLVYSLAQDRLFFSVFAYIHPKTQTPLVATIVFGIFTMIIAILIDVDELVEMLSAGTLMAFSVLAIDVLVLRYTPASRCPLPFAGDVIGESHSEYTPFAQAESSNGHGSKKQVTQDLDNIGKLRPSVARWSFMQSLNSSKFGERVPFVAIATMTISAVIFLLVLLRATDYLVSLTWWAILLEVIFGLTTLLSFCTLLLYEHNTSLTGFQMPLVPFLPALSILLNVALIIRLSALAWLRVLVWNIIGFLIYFLYGMHQSVEGSSHKDKVKNTLSLNGIKPVKASDEPAAADGVKESDNLSTWPSHTNEDY